MKTQKRGHEFFIGCWSVLLLCCLFVQGTAAEKHVTLSTTEYPPYYGEQLDNQGFITEIIREAFQQVGYEVSIKFMPWNRAFEMTKEGGFDGVYTAWYRENREVWFAFSDPLPPNELGFYALKKRHLSYATIEDLRPYRIGVVRGYSNPPDFDNANLHLDEATKDVQNILKLQAGRIDLALIDKVMGQYIINTKFPDATEQFHWIEPALKTDYQYLMFSKQKKGYQLILDDFNQGLRQLSKKGKVDEIIAKYGFSVKLPSPDESIP